MQNKICTSDRALLVTARRTGVAVTILPVLAFDRPDGCHSSAIIGLDLSQVLPKTVCRFGSGRILGNGSVAAG